MAKSGQSAMAEEGQIIFIHGDKLARYDIKSKKQVWLKHLVDKKKIAAEAAEDQKRIAANKIRIEQSNPDADIKVPSVEATIKSCVESAEEELELRVHSKNIWVAGDRKLTRYDWDTGEPTKTIPFEWRLEGARGKGAEIILADSDYSGSEIIRKVNLVTGEVTTNNPSRTASMAVVTGDAPAPQATFFMTTCKNCETSFEGKFCPNCSQKADTHRLTVKHFAHEFFHSFTHTDKGILFLMKELIVRPGHAIREYNEGKRKKYFNPITFLLIASALQLFATRQTHMFEHYMNSLEAITAQMAPNKKVGEEISKSVKQQTEKPLTFTMKYSKLLTFLFIPVLGLFTWLLFKRSGVNYAENLVLNVMISGQLSILFLLLCVVSFLVQHLPRTP